MDEQQPGPGHSVGIKGEKLQAAGLVDIVRARFASAKFLRT